MLLFNICTDCTPYLLQLGLTKTRTSLVWVAGPLSGLIMQPVVGALTDNSKSKWGRRRPFMVGGTVFVALCLILLGWTSEFVGLFVSDPSSKKTCTVVVAVFSIYGLDFAINAVQGSCRSLIVDTLPISQQQLGSAWASRMIAIGHLAGYAVGTLDLPGIFGKLLGDTQFKQLCLIAAVFFVSTVGVTCWAVGERILVSSRDADVKSGALKTITRIIKTALNLPPRIQAICWVHFWAWVGWFSFLFYSATWVGEVYFRYHPETDAKASADALGDVGRVGSLSLVVFSIVTFLSSILLPWLVQSPSDTLSAKSDFSNTHFAPRPPKLIEPFVQKFVPLINYLQDNKPDLLTTWQYSHLIFAGTMCLAPFVRSIGMATVLVSLCGIPWALACWAPFAFMGIEINRLTINPSALPNGYHRRMSTAEDLADPAPSPTFLRLNHLDRDVDDDEPSAIEDPASTGETAGIYLGILNLFGTLPQFAGTFINMIIFSLLEPGKSPELHDEQSKEDVEKAADGTNAIAVCLFIGAISAAGAAYATARMRRGRRY